MQFRTSICFANLLRSFADKRSHLLGKTVHCHLLRTGLSAGTYLSNRLIVLYLECNNHDYARYVFDKMPIKDIYSWNTMLTARCRAGALQEAYELFDRMPERNGVSWNNLISAMVRSGCEEKALVFFYMMISEGIIPTRFTLTSVLSACCALSAAEYGKRCHGIAVKIGLDKKVFSGNALLCMYAKCGFIADAIQVFQDLVEPNEVSFTTMIGGLAQANRVLEAFQMFSLMFEKGIRIDLVCLSNILGVYSHRGYGEFHLSDDHKDILENVFGKQIHGIAFKLGFLRDLHLNNSLLYMYTKNGDMDSAEMHFAEMPGLNAVSWNLMIAGYGHNHQRCKSMEYLEKMRNCGFEPNEISYVNLLGAFVKSGDIETGRRMFDSMSNPSVSSWNAVLSGYSQNENHREAINLFREMQFQNVKPNRTTLAVILSSCTGMGFLEGGRQVHAVSLKTKLHADNYVASGLIGVYSETGKIEITKCVFRNLPELDIVCWNSMISGFSLNSLDKDAFVLFKQMQQNGIFPTESSYATILGACANLSSSFQGRQAHTQLMKDGYASDVFVGTALVNMYCKCGDVEAAREFFNAMSTRNIVTWNEMIHGYGKNGYGEEGICLYRNMISSGEKPDDITFVSVLTACSHQGLVNVGVEILNSMKTEYGIVPKLEHYICVLDCLGRAGRFQEAEFLVEKMPYKNNPIIWEVLLSSCRVHANVSLGKQAADELFRLDPQNSAPYVLLANMYSCIGQWDEAKAVRRLMNQNNVLKNPGFSWIENTDNRESRFCWESQSLGG